MKKHYESSKKNDMFYKNIRKITKRYKFLLYIIQYVLFNTEIFSNFLYIFSFKGVKYGTT